MLKDILFSIVGHTAVVLSVFVPSFLHGKPPEIRTVYSVKAVTPQALPRPASQPAPQTMKNERVPQVQVKQQDQELPRPTYKPKQTVKQEKPVPNKTEETKPAQQQQSANAADPTSGFSGIRLDSEFDYPEYLIDMQRRIKNNWQPPTVRQTLITRVFFRIGSDGRIVRAYVESPTGNVPFDTSALRAITRSGPFPPLPADYGREDLGVHFDFIYEM